MVRTVNMASQSLKLRVPFPLVCAFIHFQLPVPHPSYTTQNRHRAHKMGAALQGNRWEKDGMKLLPVHELLVLLRKLHARNILGFPGHGWIFVKRLSWDFYKAQWSGNVLLIKRNNPGKTQKCQLGKLSYGYAPDSFWKIDFTELPQKNKVSGIG